MDELGDKCIFLNTLFCFCFYKVYGVAFCLYHKRTFHMLHLRCIEVHLRNQVCFMLCNKRLYRKMKLDTFHVKNQQFKYLFQDWIDLQCCDIYTCDALVGMLHLQFKKINWKLNLLVFSCKMCQSHLILIFWQFSLQNIFELVCYFLK